MFARVTTLQFKKGTTEDGIGIFEHSVIPAAKAQRGYRGAYLLADREADRCIAVTFWDSAEDAAANEQNRYYQEQLVKFMNLFSAPPIREGYDVAVAGL
jgi:heme-degrading monooxygenase HmoA